MQAACARMRSVIFVLFSNSDRNLAKGSESSGVGGKTENHPLNGGIENWSIDWH